MDFELDRERQLIKNGYRWSWLGFSVYGIMMLLSSLVSVGELLLLFQGQPGLGRNLGIADFDFFHYSFRAWTRVLATYCIFMAWAEPTWRRRSGLLFLLSMIDLGLWGVDFAVRDGYFAEADSHPILRQNIASALGWSRFVLIASIARSFAQHVGNTQLETFTKTTQATAGLGFTLWFFYLLEQIDWAHGWPLRVRPMNSQLLFIYLGSCIVTTICLLQASRLCLMCSRDASRTLRALKAEDAAQNPWDEHFR